MEAIKLVTKDDLQSNKFVFIMLFSLPRLGTEISRVSENINM